MKYFKVDVAGFGSIYVQTVSAAAAGSAARKFLGRQGIDGNLSMAVAEVSGVPQGADLVNSSGNYIYPFPWPVPQPADAGDSTSSGDQSQGQPQGQPSGTEGQGSPSNGSGTAAPANTSQPPSNGQDSAGQTPPPAATTTPTPAPPSYKVFRVDIPGFGSVWVEAPQPSGATEAAIAAAASEIVSRAVNFARNRQFQIGQTDAASLAAVETGAGVPNTANGFLVDRSGYSRELREGRSLYRVDVSSLQSVYVVADSAEKALQAAKNLAGSLSTNGATPTFGTPTAIDYGDLPMSAPKEYVIDQDGASRSDLLTGEGDDANDNLPDTTQLAEEWNAISRPLVAKIVTSGNTKFVTIDTAESDEARERIKARYGPDVQILSVSTAGNFLGDPEFVALVKSLDDNVSSVSELLAKLEPVGAGSSAGQGDGGGGNGDGGESLPFDAQNFPLATYLNAVEGLGFDPNGILGSILTNRFYEINPAINLGTTLGLIPGYGNDPGSLEQRYREQFGNNTISTDVLRKLFELRDSGNTDLAYSDYISPNLAGVNNANNLLAIARAAAAERYGSYVAGNLLPSYQRLITEYERLVAAANGEPEESFLDFARRQSLLPANF
jgi:hypothetical protein